MRPYQERVVTEKHDLDERIHKLARFILSVAFRTVDLTEQERMKQQLNFMRKYSEVLSERIANFS